MNLTGIAEAAKTLPKKLINKETLNIRYLILWFMVAVYPLVIVPHPFYIVFPAGTAPPSYICGPRYIILGIVSIIALIILIKDRAEVNHPAFIPLMFFIIFLLVSSFLAPIPMTAWIGSPFRFTGASTYFFCIILFTLAQTTEKPERLLRPLAITATIVSFLALLQYLGLDLVPPGIGYSEPKTGSGTLGNPDFLGTYTIFILPAAISLFLRSKKPSWLFCAGVVYTGLLVSLCRGAWLAGVIGFLVLAMYIWKRQEERKLFLLLTVVFLMITMALLPVQDWHLLKRICSLSDELTSGVRLEHEAGSYRLYIWKNCLKLIRIFWAFGIGPDHLIYGKLMLPNNTVADKAHNIYLEIAVTMGIFALIAYLTFLSFFLRKWKSETGFVLFVMILVYLIQGFFNIDVVMIMPLFWIILGISLSLDRKAHSPDPQP
jgi:O-antigen ligase